MKFLAFVDLHQSFEEILILKEKSNEVDFIICLGDFTIFGNNVENLLEILNDFGKKIYLIHGNHEDEKELSSLCKNYKNIEFVHKKIIEINNKIFVFYGGGGFSKFEPEFKRLVKRNKKLLDSNSDLILCTHAPPLNTKMDRISEGWHVGIKDFKDFIKNYSPSLSISGHIHESYKKKQILGKSLLVNPGGDGEVFEID